jgi:hypothetical protein
MMRERKGTDMTEDDDAISVVPSSGLASTLISPDPSRMPMPGAIMLNPTMIPMAIPPWEMVSAHTRTMLK